MPKVMRVWPVSMSVPTIESSNPARIIAIAFGTEPFASTTANTRPSTISEKYSAGPNFSATSVSGLPSAATKMVATQPAKNEPIAAVARAVRRGPDAPSGGRHVVTTDADSPWNIHQIRRRRAAYIAP